MLDKILLISCVFLVVTIFLCLIRAVIGPSGPDRLIAVNVIGTKTIILIAISSFIYRETYFIDVALVYGLISFLSTVGFGKYIMGRSKEDC